MVDDNHELEALLRDELTNDVPPEIEPRLHQHLDVLRKRITESESGRHESRMRLRLTWTAGLSVPVAAAVIVASIIFWPGQPNGARAWADVVQQLRDADTVHLRVTNQYDPGTRAGSGEAYLEWPDRAWIEYTPANKEGEIHIMNGGVYVRIDHARRTFQKQPVPAHALKGFRMMMGLFGGLAQTPQAPTEPVMLGDQHWRLIFGRELERDGRLLRRYRVEKEGVISKTDVATPRDEPTTFVWFDARSDEFVLMTEETELDGERVESQVTEVRLDIRLPDDLFAMVKPDGYQEIGEVYAIMSPEALAVQKEYYKARGAIQRYRMARWFIGVDGSTQLYARGARDGDRWRVDTVELDQANPRQWDEEDFELLWERVLGATIQDVAMTIGDRVASTHDERVEGESVKVAMWANLLNQYRLEARAWPKWPGDSGLDTIYQMLSPDPDRPTLIRIRAERNPEPPNLSIMEVFWIDPDKDFLCVRHETYQRKLPAWAGRPEWQPDAPVNREGQAPSPRIEHDWVREILEFTQTSDGRWLPALIQEIPTGFHDGTRYPSRPQYIRFRIDTAGPIDPAYFDWPDEMPEPE